MKNCNPNLGRLTAWLLPLMLCAALSLTSCGGGGGSTPSTDPVPKPAAPAQSAGASPEAKAMANKLASGVNFGNVFEAPTNGEWGISYSATTTLTAVASSMGFKSVRLPVRWSNHASATAPYTIDPVFMAQVKSTVKGLNDQGLVVVLNMHHYRELDGDELDRSDKPGLGDKPTPISTDHKTRMVMMWKQIAEEFKSFPVDKLLFEVYNEPHGDLQIGQGSVNDPWNALLTRAVEQIRATNPTRILVVGPTLWNNAYNLQYLKLPADPNLIVTIHQYEPFSFTHQGASWINPMLPTGQTCCSQTQKDTITRILNVAKSWSDKNGYPIYVGEFGAYPSGDYSANMTTQRVNFNSYMRTEMARVGFSWAYWELASGFGVYDMSTNTTRTTLLQSLIP